MEKQQPDQNVILMNNPNYNQYATNPPPYEPTTVIVKPVSYGPQRDYLCLSIFNLICCSLCLGIPAVIFSIKAREQYRSGHIAEAEKSSSCAKTFNIIGIVIGCCLIAISLIWVFTQFAVITALFFAKAASMDSDNSFYRISYFNFTLPTTASSI